MEVAPRTLDGADVVVYSPIDHRHRPTGHCRHTVRGVPQGPAAGLAICRYDGENSFYPFGCDPQWNVVTDTFHDTLTGAMAQAEFEYEGVGRTWVNHAPAWSPLDDSEEQIVWALLDEKFRFRSGGLRLSGWRGIDEPVPSVTYDIASASGEEAGFDALEADLNLKVLYALRQCVPPGGEVFALDWQHACYRMNPFGRFDVTDPSQWALPPLPEGDYHIFLADDFSFGLFGHPWEQTICVFGAALLEAVRQEHPRLLTRVVRRDGQPSR